MTAWVLVQFTSLIGARAQEITERDGKAAGERKAKGKEGLVVKCASAYVIQSKPPAAPLIFSMLGCCEKG